MPQLIVHSLSQRVQKVQNILFLFRFYHLSTSFFTMTCVIECLRDILAGVPDSCNDCEEQLKWNEGESFLLMFCLVKCVGTLLVWQWFVLVIACLFSVVEGIIITWRSLKKKTVVIVDSASQVEEGNKEPSNRQQEVEGIIVSSDSISEPRSLPPQEPQVKLSTEVQKPEVKLSTEVQKPEVKLQLNDLTELFQDVQSLIQWRDAVIECLTAFDKRSRDCEVSLQFHATRLEYLQHLLEESKAKAVCNHEN